MRVPPLVCLCSFPGVVLSSRVTGACPVTTDLIMRVNVRTTTTTTTIYTINSTDQICGISLLFFNILYCNMIAVSCFAIRFCLVCLRHKFVRPVAFSAFSKKACCSVGTDSANSTNSTTDTSNRAEYLIKGRVSEGKC